MIELESATIDSLSLSIPIEDVEIINHNFTSRIVLYYYDTEEFDEELQNSKPLVFSFDGITLRFRIAERFISDKLTQRFLILTLSSKLLKSRYFEGITKDNISLLYHEIMSLNVFKCSYSSFLDARVSDVDFCYNYKISQETFFLANKKLISFALPGKNRFFNLFKKKDKKGNFNNLGLDINSRSKSTPSLPYLKNYYKTIELTTKSLEFYNKFLRESLQKSNTNIRNLARIEYTCKGWKQKRRLLKKGLLKNNFSSLTELLKVSKNEMKQIIFSGFKDYCEIPNITKSKLSIKGLTPIDSLIVNLMEQLIVKGSDKLDFYDVLQSYHGKQKSRLKSKINNLITHIETNSLSLENKLKQNEELNSFLDKLR